MGFEFENIVSIATQLKKENEELKQQINNIEDKKPVAKKSKNK